MPVKVNVRLVVPTDTGNEGEIAPSVVPGLKATVKLQDLPVARPVQLGGTSGYTRPLSPQAESPAVDRVARIVVDGDDFRGHVQSLIAKGQRSRT